MSGSKSRLLRYSTKQKTFFQKSDNDPTVDRKNSYIFYSRGIFILKDNVDRLNKKKSYKTNNKNNCWHLSLFDFFHSGNSPFLFSVCLHEKKNI